MIKNNIKIENMSISNLEQFNYGDFDDFWNVSTIMDDIKSNNSMYIIAKLNDEIIGFAGIKIILDEAEIMNIATKKIYRHEGIASLMLEYLISYCKKNSINSINLEVNIQNSIAIKLYKKYNFNEVGLRKKYYNNTYDAVLMTLNI